MPCHYPLTAYRGRTINPETGKRPLAFSTRDGYHDTQLKIACGQCRGCRRSHAREWATRCVHEASQYKNNCFITLTFNEKYLNSTGTLVKEDFQLFMKRLRKQFVPKNPHKKGTADHDKWIKEHGIRYYHCGEYGTIHGRPHHHACLFNHNFTDKVLWKETNGIRLFRSPTLESLWSDPITGDSYGYSTIGDVTYDSAAYVAGYIDKKISGIKAPDHYQGRQPEYSTMSRRPAIGKGWLEKYSQDLIQSQGLILPGGYKHKVPKYYDKHLELTNPEEYANMKALRIMKTRDNPDGDQRRLHVRQMVEDGKYSLKKKTL